MHAFPESFTDSYPFADNGYADSYTVYEQQNKCCSTSFLSRTNKNKARRKRIRIVREMFHIQKNGIPRGFMSPEE